MTGPRVLWLSSRAATYPENPTIQYILILTRFKLPLDAFEMIIRPLYQEQYSV